MFARTLRTTFAAALLALSVVPAAAFASPADSGAKTSESVRQEKREKESFPMPAAEFRTKVENRVTKSRERMVERMAERKVSADVQKERLEKFDKIASKVQSKLDEVCADGTVTREEAREVHKLAHELRGKAHHKAGEKGAAHPRKAR